MGMYDMVFFHNDNRFLKRVCKINNADLKDWDFQTKSLTNDLTAFYINIDNKFIHDGVWLEKFTGSFEGYSYIYEHNPDIYTWFDLFLIIENGMLKKTIIEQMEIANSIKIRFGKHNKDNIPDKSLDYLRRMLKKNETNRNRFGVKSVF